MKLPTDEIWSPKTNRQYEKAFKKVDKENAKKQRDRLRTRKKINRKLRFRRVLPWAGFGVIIAILLAAQCHATGGFSATSTLASAPDRPKVNIDTYPQDPAPFPLSGQSGEHTFVLTHKGTDKPVTWDRCRPIRVVTYGTPPEGSEELLDSALAELSSASGFEFIQEGPTAEEPSELREAFQPELYEDRWAPLLFAWSNPMQSPELEGNVAGTGGGIAVYTTNGKLYYASGAVTLDTPQVSEMLSLGDQRSVKAIMIHEFAHALGLDHVEDPNLLMFSETTPTNSQLGPGDMLGLSLLAQGGCAKGL